MKRIRATAELSVVGKAHVTPKREAPPHIGRHNFNAGKAAVTTCHTGAPHTARRAGLYSMPRTPLRNAAQGNAARRTGTRGTRKRGDRHGATCSEEGAIRA